MEDLAIALITCTIIICITLGGLKDCDHDQALRMKCMDKNWTVNIRGECVPPEPNR